MLTQRGSLDCLQDPIALRLLRSSLPAYVVCDGEDGTRRMVTAPFHWDGAELLLCLPRNALRMPVLRDGAEVSISIDSDVPPWSVLLIRGETLRSASMALDREQEVRVRPVWAGMLEFRVRGDVDRREFKPRP